MLPTEPTLPPIVDAVDADDDVTKLPEELIEGFLHVGSRGVLGGGSKTNKTWLLIGQAIAVASGTPWLGFKTKKARVLYVNLEIQHQFFGKRVKDVAKAAGVELERGQLRILNLRGHSDGFQKLIPKIIGAAKDGGFELVIIDPIYKLLGASDENKATDVALLLNSMDMLSTTLKCSVFFAAHFTKGNQSEKYAIDRISGSGVFGRDPDTIMTLTKHEEDDCFTVDLILRNHAPREPFVVKWKYPTMREEKGLDPGSLHKVPTRGAKFSVTEVSDYLPNDGITTTEWEQIVKDRMGCSRSTFLRNMRKLEKEGKVFKDKDLWRKVPEVSQVSTPIYNMTPDTNPEGRAVNSPIGRY